MANSFNYYRLTLEFQLKNHFDDVQIFVSNTQYAINHGCFEKLDNVTFVRN